MRMRKNLDTFILRKARSVELETLIAIDNAASELYEQAGLKFAFEKDHPFVVAESARWADAIQQGLAYVAVNHQDYAIGFMTLGFVDGEPYLDQLAVRPENMRSGIGTSLLRHAISWSGEQALWLTTYEHLPWNAPYYQRSGFVPAPENLCGTQMRALLQAQRSVLPEPDKRVAMLRR